MKLTDLLHPDFVAAAEAILSEHCVDGKALSRKEFCQLLDIEVAEESFTTLETAIGALISLGAISGYEVRPGRYGGFGKIGDKRPVKARTKGEGKPRAPKSKTFPEGFVEAVQSNLEVLAEDGKAVTRRAIAEAMGQPGSQTEIMISKAYNAGLLESFVTKIGPFGGFIRASEIKMEENTPNTEQAHQPVGTDGDGDMLSI